VNVNNQDSVGALVKGRRGRPRGGESRGLLGGIVVKCLRRKKSWEKEKTQTSPPWATLRTGCGAFIH